MANKPWLDKYASGIAANVDYQKYQSLHQFLQESFEKYKDLVAYTSMGKEMTFHEIEVSATYLAAYLQSRGLNPGDKVAIVLPNVLQFPIAAYAVLKAGLVLVNTNPLYTAHEMKHQFLDSEARAIIILENFAAEFEKIAAETNIDVIITTQVGELLGSIKGAMVNFVVRYIKKMVPRHNLVN